MKSYIIPENILAGLIDYLSKQPYNQVKQAMDILPRLAKGPELPNAPLPTPAEVTSKPKKPKK